MRAKKKKKGHELDDDNLIEQCLCPITTNKSGPIKDKRKNLHLSVLHLPVLVTVRVSKPSPNTSQVPVVSDQAQGHWRNQTEEDDANECGQPQAIEGIHYVFAEQDPITGEDLKQRITVPWITRHWSRFLALIPYSSSVSVPVKWVVELLQVSVQMGFQSEKISIGSYQHPSHMRS